GALSNSRYVPDVSCSGAKRGSSTDAGRRHWFIFCAADFHFHHHVLRDDTTAEEAAGTTAEVNGGPLNRGPGRDPSPHPPFNLACEGNHRAGESSRQREDRDGEIGHRDGAQRKLIVDS